MATPVYSLAPTSAIATVLGHGWAVSNNSYGESQFKYSGDFHALLTAATQKELNTDQVDSDDEDAPKKKKRVYKKRKSTHTVRKEERLALEEELEALQAKLEALKFQALVQSGDEDISLRRQMDQNSGLQSVIQENHLVVAQAEAMLMGCMQPHSYNVRPTEMCIHLPSNSTERRETLAALRGMKLNHAKQFIEQRSAGLHPTADYFSEERYETPEGDFCNVRFERTSLRGVTGGVRAVLDALRHAIFHAEIILSETSGMITIRENDDMDGVDNFSQMKLVTESTPGILVENNIVHFSDYVENDDERQSYAIAAADFVDKDDLFPYCPHERIRRDATTVILVTSYPSNKAPTSDLDVVVTRWTFSRICNSSLNIPAEFLRGMRDRSGLASEIILNCARETLHLK